MFSYRRCSLQLS